MNVNSLIKFRKNKILSKFIQKILLKKGLDLPYTVSIGKNIDFPHNSIGTVIHPNTVIGNNVKIYQNVTLGRADIYIKSKYSKFKGFYIDDGVVIGAGAKILCKEGMLKIGKNSVVGANSVVLSSIGNNEIWAGNPARKIRDLTLEELDEKDINC